jgi:lipopolysaccharide export system protein LptA
VSAAPFRLTIERLRTLVLIAAGLLIAALIGALVLSRWKSRFSLNEIPKRLGVDIQQEANGVTYTQSRGGHTLFKIHASKVVQLKAGGKALLHDVQIELYGEDGSRVDRIAGNEFEYDQKAGIATAAGPVEITLMKPGVAPAVASRGAANQPSSNKQQGAAPGSAGKTAASSLNISGQATSGEIDVKTSGLTFNQKTGTATTDQSVEFTLAQGEGSAVGATLNSSQGLLVLDHAVVLNTHHNGENIAVHAQHAEFDRTMLACDLRSATANYRNSKATAAESKILFRQDGSAIRLDAHGGFTLATASGSHVAAPQGWLEFGEKNQPQRGHMEGGVTLDSVTAGRQSHGSAPTADLAFTSAGDLRHAHLERGVTMHSEEDASGSHVSRDWRSPVADIDFRAAGKGAKGKMEIASVTGEDGVVMSGQTRRGDGFMTPSRMAADQIVAEFGAGQQVSQVKGTGHASFEQTTASGAMQTTTGDRLEANFAQGVKAPKAPSNGTQSQTASQIDSATIDGNVVMTQQPAAKPGHPPEPVLRATSGHAVYEGAGQWLHLTVNPRIQNGGLELTAEKIDVAQQAGKNEGDAFAHGNVKATWLNDGRDKSASGSPSGTVGLGGQTPAHVIASEAQFHQASGEATFRGQARLWQDANSVAAPVIVLDRTHRTLAAHGSGKSDPVRLVLLSAGGAPGQKPSESKSVTPSVIRVGGGDLLYTETARKAVLHAAPGSTVTAETGTATSNSDTVELILQPAGSHAGKDNPAAQKSAGLNPAGPNPAGQVERMTAQGNVVLTSQGRQGTGEQLVYTGQTGQYVLTGTASAPPKMNDPEHGTVTGHALIFNSRDDSVSIEGSGTKTTTVTRAPAKPGRE